MSKLICHASRYADATAIELSVTSSSFQAALTPWLCTVTGKHRFYFLLPTVKLLALSPTFQFTRDLSFDVDKEILQTAIFSPLYAHLQSLHLQVEETFDFGVETANIVLRFQRLQEFELRINVLSADPDSVIHVIQTLLARKTHFSNNFVVNFLKSTLQPWFEQILDAISDEDPTTYLPKYPIITLLKDKNIALLLQDLMLDLYKRDHGESLIVFFSALRLLMKMCQPFSHTMKEMSPTLDLIDQIVMNGDLLNSSRHIEPLVMNDEKVTEEELESSKRWDFASCVCATFQELCWSLDCSRDFMRHYGRNLFPAMLSFLISKYDHSYPAIIAIDNACSGYKAVVHDFFWFDEIGDETPGIEDIEKMTKNGRGVLAHMPFDEMAFMLEECCKHLPEPGFAGRFGISECLHWIAEYVSVHLEGMMVGARHFQKIHFIEDLVARFNNKNLLVHFFNCLEKNFETTSASEDLELRQNHVNDLEIFNSFTFPHYGNEDEQYQRGTHYFADGNRNTFFKGDSDETDNNHLLLRRVLEYAKKAMNDIETTTSKHSEMVLYTPEEDWNLDILPVADNRRQLIYINQTFVAAIERLLWVCFRRSDYLVEQASCAAGSLIPWRSKVLHAEIVKNINRAQGLKKEMREVSFTCDVAFNGINKKALARIVEENNKS